MNEEANKRKERPPTTERQAFSAYLLSVWVIGVGCGASIVGLSGVIPQPVGGPVTPAAALVVGALVVFVGVILHRGIPRTLRPFERFAKDKAAVSPVIAVILMVAITVVLAAVVFVLVSDLGHVPNAPPKMTFGHDGDDLMVLSIDQPTTWGELSVAGCSVVPEANATIVAGDLATDCSGQVVVVHTPTNTLLYRTEFAGA